MFQRMCRNGKLLALLAGLGCALVAISCFGDSGARGEPIRVAFAGPTSGPSAEDGLSAVRAIELVFERVNAAGGVGGRPLALATFDDANDPARAREVAAQIAGSDAVAVIGHNTSTCSIAAGEIYASRGVPAVATAATNVDVTRGDWYFRVIFDDRTQGRFVVASVREILGEDRFGLVHETAAYGGFLAEVMAETATEIGLPLAARWSFDPDTSDVEARLDAIAAQATGPGAPPVLVLAMQPTAGVPLVKSLRDRGYDGEILVTDALASQAFAEGFGDTLEERRQPGFYTDGIYASTPFLFDGAGRLGDRFRNEYAARHGDNPDWYAAFAADAASVLVEALRRSELSPSAATLETDRRALRDALAAIGPSRPVEGITGPTWFDADGNAAKPVPMGRFLNRDLLSAFVQLRLLGGGHRADADDGRFDPERVVHLGDALLYRTDLARVGVRARRFGELDFVKGTFEMEFDLWFRHGGDRDVEQLVFTNAVEPVELGAPVDEIVVDELHYRLYRGEGLFRADAIEAPYGGHVLSLSFHHRERTRDDLELAVDTAGMNLGRRSTDAQRGAAARQLLDGSTKWTVAAPFFFESVVDEPALGHPAYLAGGAASRPFSQLTIGVGLRDPGLRSLLPVAYQREILGIAALGTVVLLFAGRRSASALRFALQCLFALLLLLAAEPVLGSMSSGSGLARPAAVRRAFDLLWWVVPALLVMVAIERFVWRRTEARTGVQVPSLLRWFVASIVLVVACFGIVAFVYDYRLTGLLATSGVLAMVIGLAVQLNITNMFAGVAINLERPFRVGDWIMIHGRTPDPESSVIGQVVDINWRTTRLNTADDTAIVIPNGVISEKTITNFNQPGEMSRFSLTFPVDQSVPPETVIAVIQQAVDDVIGAEKGGPLADPPPKVRIDEATLNGIEYVVRYRIRPREVSPLTARHTINQSVLHHLREAGIEIAVPHRRVREEAPGESDEAPR